MHSQKKLIALSDPSSVLINPNNYCVVAGISDFRTYACSSGSATEPSSVQANDSSTLLSYCTAEIDNTEKSTQFSSCSDGSSEKTTHSYFSISSTERDLFFSASNLSKVGCVEKFDSPTVHVGDKNAVDDKQYQDSVADNKLPNEAVYNHTSMRKSSSTSKLFDLRYESRSFIAMYC